MRLTCPNCDAQYEVAEDAIPPGGRDVQCSNCGHAWFQPSADAADAAAGDDEEGPVPPAAAPAAAVPAVDGDDGEAAPVFDQPPPLRRHEVDETVLAILREEAERETEARRREEAEAQAAARPVAAPAAPAAEPAPPGLSAEARPDPDGYDLMTDQGLVVGRPGKGRELLPDIDAIKSTLQASGDRPVDDGEAGAEADAPPPARRSGGFRMGFGLTLSLGALLAVVYATAPGLIARFPAAEPALGAYVAGVNDTRLWIDRLARQAGDRLSAQSADGTATP